MSKNNTFLGYLSCLFATRVMQKWVVFTHSFLQQCNIQARGLWKAARPSLVIQQSIWVFSIGASPKLGCCSEVPLWKRNSLTVLPSTFLWLFFYFIYTGEWASLHLFGSLWHCCHWGWGHGAHQQNTWTNSSMSYDLASYSVSWLPPSSHRQNGRKQWLFRVGQYFIDY